MTSRAAFNGPHYNQSQFFYMQTLPLFSGAYFCVSTASVQMKCPTTNNA